MALALKRKYTHKNIWWWNRLRKIALHSQREFRHLFSLLDFCEKFSLFFFRTRKFDFWSKQHKFDYTFWCGYLSITRVFQWRFGHTTLFILLYGLKENTNNTHKTEIHLWFVRWRAGKKNSLAKTIFVKISVKKEQKKMLGHLFKTQFTVKLIYFEDPLHIYANA